jgi:hypothetical protein
MGLYPIRINKMGRKSFDLAFFHLRYWQDSGNHLVWNVAIWIILLGPNITRIMYRKYTCGRETQNAFYR